MHWVFAIAILSVLAPAHAQAEMRAAEFLDRISVNTHIPYTDGAYRNVDQVIDKLHYLGISNVRDGISNGAAGSAPIGSYIAMARHGIRWTFLATGGGAVTSASLSETLKLIGQVAQAAPGSVAAVEGSNEINNFPITWNGSTGTAGQAELDAAVALQRALYAAVHRQPDLAHVKVAMFTGASAGTIPAAPDPGTTPGLADYATQHPYPNHGEPPLPWIRRERALAGMTGPAVYTETGYSTNGGTSGAVNAGVQARYSLDLLCDAAKIGIAQTSLYQLLDAYAPGSRQGDEGFGFFYPDGSPKLLATAMHNLTAILRDPEPAPPNHRALPEVTLDGLPASGQSLRLTRADNAADILVWAEPKIWEVSAGAEIPAPKSRVTVTLKTAAGQIKVFDPLIGQDPISVVSSGTTVTVEVTDHPVIIQVTPRS